MLKLLIVEDELALREFYAQLLKHPEVSTRFEGTIARDADSALKAMARQAPDIVVLDWGLPGKSGMEVLDSIRSDPKTRAAQVFVVTSFAAKAREVEALEAGADDYLAKPFDPGVLVARLLNLAKRLERGASSQFEKPETLELDELRLEMPVGLLKTKKKTLQLHRKEAELLRLFMRRPNVIHRAEYLWENVWGYSSENFRHTLHVTLSNLRQRLEPRWAKRLENIKDQGYLFRLS